MNRPDGDISSSDVISWDIGYSDLPLIMYVGDSLDIALTAPNISDPVPYVGSTVIISMDVLSSADHTVKVRLTAKAAGMTSINLASATDSESMTLPREICVADSEGKVPHLTRDGTIDDIIEQLTSEDITSGNFGGWYEYNGSSSAASEDVDTGIKTTEPVEVIAGLSVNPRFAVPTDPSGDAYIKRYPAQILAVVLPEMTVSADGIYTFRIPAENITPKGTKIFIHTDLSSDISSVYTPDGISLIYSKDICTLNYEYSVLVRIDKEIWQSRTSDVYLPGGLAFSVEKADANGDISRFRIYAESNYSDAYEGSESKDVTIRAYNRKEEDYEYFSWSFNEDDTGMNYYDDDGTELEYISGDEYINVAVYLSAGTYTPFITAKAPVMILFSS